MKPYKYKKTDSINPSDPISDELLYFTKSVKKPWSRFIVMAVFFFFVLGIIRVYFLSFATTEGMTEIIDGSINASHLLGLVIIYGIYRLNKFFVYLAVGITAVSICIQLYWFVRILMAGNFGFQMMMSLFYLALSGFCAFYLLRPSFKKLMDRNEAYNRYIGLQNVAKDSLNNK